MPSSSKELRNPKTSSAVYRLRDESEGSFEQVAGYSRAVRLGSHISVSGTGPSGNPLPRSTYDQAADCLRRVITAVEQLGGTRESIVRTRVYLAPEADWKQAAAAHRELLGDVAPANTTLFAGSLIGPGFLIEVEADAEVTI
ncbi:MAG: Rid family hydrolase [Actinomycetota bacterium]|jgi:enamine deaminase RidA (YjgF/YER057c/UK114 family)|nr:Rid family hydrolase [Actinomycetota bacterium]